MLEEEIIKINQKLKKMIDKSEIDQSVVQGLLSRCDELRITLVILQKTGIGKTVNELRRATNDDHLTEMTKNLLKKWKTLLPESSASNEKMVTPKDKASESTTSASIMPKQTARVKSRELLANALSVAGLPEGSGDPMDLSIRIESAIFDEIKDTNVKYGRRIRSRIFNLRDLKNPDLRHKVLLGLITPEQFAVMTAEEMTSDALKKECARFKEIAQRESQLAVDEGFGSDLLQCEQCKAKNCSYSELQTLSGDEPMTLFVLCRNCGHRWRG